MLVLKADLTLIIFSKKYNPFFEEILIEPIESKQTNLKIKNMLSIKGSGAVKPKRNYLY